MSNKTLPPKQIRGFFGDAMSTVNFQALTAKVQPSVKPASPKIAAPSPAKATHVRNNGDSLR
jgi:hypothetical protein